MAAEISRLSVVLTANSTGLAGGLKGGQTALTSLGASANRVKGIFAGLGGILGAAGLSFGIWSGFEKAKEGERAVAILGAVVKSTGQAAGFSAKQLQDMSGNMAGLTEHGRAAVIAAASVLATFTNIRGDEFKEAMEAAANMSAVLDQDLKTSVVQLGKALNDPAKGYTALKRAGVSFTQAQIEQIKAMSEAGDVLGGQKIILKELAVEFGGAAKAAGATFSNQISKAKGSVTAIAIAIGSGMLPALAGMANQLKVGAKWAGSHKDELFKLGKGIIYVVGAIVAYKTIIFAITVAQRAWNAIQAVTLALQGPKGWATLAAAAAIAGGAILALNKAYEPVAAAMKESSVATAQARQQMAGLNEDESDAADVAGAATKGTKKLADQVADLTRGLREQKDAFGLSARAADVHKLAMQGATAAELTEARGLSETIDRLEAKQKAYEDLAATAAKITDDIKDDFEKMADAIEEVNKVQAAGLLSAALADKARMQLTQDAFRKNDSKKSSEPKSFAAPEKLEALEKRFTRGFTQDNVPWQDKILAENTKAAKAAEEIKKNTRKTAEKKDLVVSIG